jgi:hypothetical protein
MNLTVELRHSPNPDIYGGYWQEPAASGRPVRMPVRDMPTAIDLVRHYIDANSLGGGNWTGGTVREGRKVVGRISYNGRFWPVGHEYGPKVPS